MRILLASIYPYAFLLLYLSIPFDNYIRALPNILTGILIAFFLFIIKKSDFKRLRTAPFIAYLVFVGFLVINSAIQGRLETDFTFINKILLTLGLVIFYLPIQDMTKVKNAVIFSALAAILFSVVNIFILVNVAEDVALSFPRQVVEALLIDRLYLGLLSIFSILISFQSIRSKYHANNPYHLANIVINVLFIFLMLSKIAVIILIMLLILKQLYGKQRILRTGIAVVLALIGAYFFVLPNTQNDGETTGSKLKQENIIASTFTWELRKTVWDCAYELIESKPLMLSGIGFEETREELVKCYDDNLSMEKRDRFVTNRYNTHNQFIDLYLTSGIIAMILFMAFLLVTLFASWKRFLSMAFLLVLLSYCLVENVYHRQIGAYYVGLILIMLLIDNKFSQNKAVESE